MVFISQIATIILLLILLFLSLRERKRMKNALEAEKLLVEKNEELKRAAIREQEISEAKALLGKALEDLKKANADQASKIEDLRTALNAHSFDGRFPICSSCKDIRDENGCWHTIEEFIEKLSSNANFSHTLCPDCARKLYPDMFEDGKKLHTLTWK